jgi:hypothetical protein
MKMMSLISSKVMMNQFQRTFFLLIRKIHIFESALIHRRTHTRIKKASMLIDELDIIFFNSPRTVVDSFTTVIPLQQLECADFLDYFKNNKVEKGWKRFYKKYPKAIGALAFSKVVYLDNYACLYMDFKRHGLFASGDVYILRKKDQSWEIITKINSYKA